MTATARESTTIVRSAGLTELDDDKRSFVARMFNITSFMMTLKEHITLPYNARTVLFRFSPPRKIVV